MQQNSLPLKPSPIQVARIKFPTILDSFFTKAGTGMVISVGWVAAGQMAGKGMTFKMSEEGKRVK